MKTYHVSRATARKAMEMLAIDGLVSKKRGYGTFVISAQPNTSPQRVVRYTRKNRVDQVIAVKRMINQKVMKAPKDIAECLQLSDDCDIIRIKRVRYAGEEPFYLEINYFEQSFVPEVMEHDFRKNLCVSFFPMPIRFNGPLPSRKSIPFWQTGKWQSCCTLLSAVRCFIYDAYPLIRIIIQGNVSVPIIAQIPTIWRLSLPYNRRFVHEADTDFACRLSRYG